MRITAEFLGLFGACPRQITTFGGLWPGGCEVTAANVKKARGAGLSVRWFASTLCRIRSRADLRVYAAELIADGPRDDYSDLMGAATAREGDRRFHARRRYYEATDPELADILVTLDDGLVYGTTYDTVSVDTRSPLKP